jgi:hypothetical protein
MGAGVAGEEQPLTATALHEVLRLVHDLMVEV